MKKLKKRLKFGKYFETILCICFSLVENEVVYINFIGSLKIFFKCALNFLKYFLNNSL